MVDALLLAMSMGVVTGVMLAAPNAIQMLDKPLELFFDKLDERQKRRKLSKIKSYLKTQGLVRGDYAHGVELTPKALRRIKQYKFQSIAISKPVKWDGKWRLVMFDIPEQKRDARIGFTRKIQEMGFQLLQQSVWIHPFQCKEEIFFVADHFGVRRWTTYIITDHIDNDSELRQRFRRTALIV